MSRNVRKKATTPKRSKRRDSDTTSSSSFGLSDEDGYSAVEEITDSEDDDEDDVDAVEEENIRTEAIAEPLTSPRPPTDDENDDDDNDDDEASDLGIDIEVDVSVDGNADLDDADEHASWPGIVSDADDDDVTDFYKDAGAFALDAAVERHVRFDIPSSDSDSTETEDDDHCDLFPDIFVDQNALDPAFRREIEKDQEEGSSDSAEFWDFAGQHHIPDDSETEEIIRQVSGGPAVASITRYVKSEDKASTVNEHIKSEDITPTLTGGQELDGYETDGDTTEEDSPEPPVRRKTRRPSVAISDVTDSESEPVTKNQRGQPRVGRFKLDRSDKKPIAVLNPLTRKMMIFTPQGRRQLDLSPEQFNFPWPVEEETTPLLGNSADLMLGTMLSSNPFGDFGNSQPLDPVTGLFPFSMDGVALDGSSSSIEGEEDDAEKNLDISDFIAWDAVGSSNDEGEKCNWQPSSTPIRPTTASSEIDVLSHLNSETVGAFRRNQINQQLILSSQATQDSLAFSGPYNYTALKGLKSDRFDTARIPLTPVRRHKKHLSDMARSPLENASTKRKASGEHANSGHKRHRSISDVNLLRL